MDNEIYSTNHHRWERKVVTASPTGVGRFQASMCQENYDSHNPSNLRVSMTKPVIEIHIAVLERGLIVDENVSVVALAR
jgi:hypothetical protein